MIERLTIVADGLDHPECVIWHPDGSLWAGGEAGQIYRIDPNSGQVEEICSTGGFILGLAFSPDTRWLAICDLGNKCLWKMDCATRELVKFGGYNYNIPNYGCFSSDGTYYVSESGAFREVCGKVIRYDPDGNESVWCEGPFNFANGMALDATEEYLYVVCSFLPGVERIRIQPDGSAGEREVYVTLPESVPDGLAFTADGNLIVSCYAPNKIYSVSPAREVSLLIDDWEGHSLANPTNIAFGGKNFDQLFTANLGRWHISRIDLQIEGLKLPCHR